MSTFTYARRAWEFAPDTKLLKEHRLQSLVFGEGHSKQNARRESVGTRKRLCSVCFVSC